MACSSAKRLLTGLLVGLTTGLALGCGESHSEADSSLCTPARDPLGAFCDNDWLDSVTAHERARALVPSDARLVSTESDRTGATDIDGHSATWLLTFFVPETDEHLRVDVTSEDAMRETARFTDSCSDPPALDVIDSTSAVRTTVLAWEDERDETLALGDGTNLYVVQSAGCPTSSPPRSDVHLVTIVSDDRFWHGELDGDGNLTRFVGPCAERDPAACE